MTSIDKFDLLEFGNLISKAIRSEQGYTIPDVLDGVSTSGDCIALAIENLATAGELIAGELSRIADCMEGSRNDD